MKRYPETERELCSLFDHTLLRPTAADADFETLCAQAAEHHFAMVAIHSAPVALCKRLLRGSGVHVGAAVAFPLGQATIEVKRYEAADAIANGADEIDYVLNLARLKQGDWGYVRKEMEVLVEVCHSGGALCKVIFENGYLTREEIIAAAQLAAQVRPDFIKTSTGFGPAGAKAGEVRLMREAAAGAVQVKAAGGIRSWESCRAMLDAGAQRIGTSSSLKILEEYRKWRKGSGEGGRT